jgi:hypothetical protein
MMKRLRVVDRIERVMFRALDVTGHIVTGAIRSLDDLLF